jgi:hypothetical protein
MSESIRKIVPSDCRLDSGFSPWLVVLLKICFTQQTRPSPWPVFTNANSQIPYIGDPVTVGEVANINSLSVFDAVYASVRGKPFAAR